MDARLSPSAPGRDRSVSKSSRVAPCVWELGARAVLEVVYECMAENPERLLAILLFAAVLTA